MTKYKQKSPNPQLTLADAPQNFTYEMNSIKIPVVALGEDIWLSQKEIAELFGADIRTVSYHISKLIENNEVPNSTIQEIRIVAPDGKLRKVAHYNLDMIIPVGYRVGSPEAFQFRQWANSIIKQYLLVGVVINERKFGSKSTLRMGQALNILDKYELTDRADVQRLSRIYENKLGGELLIAIIADICTDPNYGLIKGIEYKTLFGMFADDLKAILNTKDIRASLPDFQLQAFTLAEMSLRTILSSHKQMNNEQVLNAIKASFTPIAAYIRQVSDIAGVHHVTGKPLLGSGNQ